MRPVESSVRETLIGVALWCALAGCVSHDSGFDEPLRLPASFTTDGGSVTGTAGSTPAPDRWWLAFEDPTLDALQRDALSTNFDLAAFRDRLRAAGAVVRRERAALFPSFDYSANASRSWRGDDDRGGVTSFGAGVIGAYEVDVWNRIESETDAAAFDAAVAAEALKASTIALSAEVAFTWFALLEQRAQADVLERQIETNENVLRVVRARFGGGVVRASDVLRQERLLESTREQRAVVRARTDTLEHALLVLLGRSPTEELDVGAEEATLPQLPPAPALGLPTELMQRRPDVRSAFFDILAADAELAAAVADQYPRVTLGLDASTSAEQVADLFDDWALTLAADVLGPIFDGGRRRAEIERSRAVKAERIDVYAQTVLVALRQVVDALSRESVRTEQIDRIEKQLDLARRTTERLNREYLNGDIPYIDVLDALTTEQQLQRDLIEARFQLVSHRIDLYEALAGGWENIIPDDDDAADTGGEEASRSAGPRRLSLSSGADDPRRIEASRRSASTRTSSNGG